MKKILLLGALAILPTKALVAAEYTVDPSHTYVSLSVSHLGFSTMRGQFDRQTGSLEFDPAAKKANVMIEIDASSIDTGHDKRDAHVRDHATREVVDHDRAGADEDQREGAHGLCG